MNLFHNITLLFIIILFNTYIINIILIISYYSALFQMISF